MGGQQQLPTGIAQISWEFQKGEASKEAGPGQVEWIREEIGEDLLGLTPKLERSRIRKEGDRNLLPFQS